MKGLSIMKSHMNLKLKLQKLNHYMENLDRFGSYILGTILEISLFILPH